MLQIYSTNDLNVALSPRACFASDQDTVTLYNMLAGKYQIFSELQQKQVNSSNFKLMHNIALLAVLEQQAPHVAFRASRVKTEIQVSTLDEIVPTLQVLHSVVEVGLKPSEEIVDYVQLPIAVRLQETFPFSEVLRHVDCCLTVRLASSPLSEEPLRQCVPTTEDSNGLAMLPLLSILRVPLGLHNYSAHFRSIHPPHREFSQGQRQAEGQVEVRRMQEFKPAYEWTALHAWHTIPVGLQTRCWDL